MLFHTKEGRIRAADLEDAFRKAEKLIEDGGLGHTSSIYLDLATGQEKLAASQSVKGNLDERDFLLRWANVAEYE